MGLGNIFGSGDSSQQASEATTQTDYSAMSGGDYSPTASDGSIAAGANAIGGDYIDGSTTNTTINYSSIATTTNTGVTAGIPSAGGFGQPGDSQGQSPPALNTNTLMLIGIGVSILGILMFARRK